MYLPNPGAVTPKGFTKLSTFRYFLWITGCVMVLLAATLGT